MGCASSSSSGPSYKKVQIGKGPATRAPCPWVADRETEIQQRFRSATEFQWVRLIGYGAFGRVWLVKHTALGKYFAIKKIPRALVHSKSSAKSLHYEIELHASVDHPLCTYLFDAFQDATFTYLVMEYALGGELDFLLAKQGSLDENAARLYGAQIAAVIADLHQNYDIAFRDLKPENILIGKNGHIQLADFGLARKIKTTLSGMSMVLGSNPKSKAGTTEYMAPEMIDRMTYHGPSVDWWALGCILYQMLAGKTPFGDITEESKYSIYMRIRSGKFSFPRSISSDAKSLIKGLLTVEIKNRFGWQQVSRHPWFQAINWAAVRSGAAPSPWVPTWDAEGDSSWFPAVPPSKDDGGKYGPAEDTESDMAYLIAALRRPRVQDTVVSSAGSTTPSSRGRRASRARVSTSKLVAPRDKSASPTGLEKWKTLQKSRRDVVANIRGKSHGRIGDLKKLSVSRRMVRQGSRKNVYT